MSGTNFKCFIVVALIINVCYAVSWHHSLLTKHVDGEDFSHPARYPDTVCFAAYWSPVYRGFGIHEGMVYAGTGNVDVCLQGQYHRLMSNYQLSVGFPVLKEQTISAGLQFHYLLSTLHGVDILHKGSCSGGLILRPRPAWQVSLCSMHMLSFPLDSTERLFEPTVSVGSSLLLLPSLKASLLMEKSLNLPWRTFIGIAWTPIDRICLSLNYEPVVNHISVQIYLGIAQWKATAGIAMHSLLGFDQHYTIAYER